MIEEKKLIEQTAQAVLIRDRDTVNGLVEQALERNFDISSLINEGLTAGLRKLGDQFERSEVFLPELVLGADIVQENIKKLEPHIMRDKVQTKGKFLIGTVAGDLHDVGKNIVCAVFAAAGYEVIDLGINVSTERFVSKVQEVKPDFLGLLALLTTTMHKQREVVQALEDAGFRKDVKILIGGAPASESWVKEIKADVYAEDVFSGLRKAEELRD